MSSLSLVLSASVERGMRESGVSFARAVLSELDSAGVLNCSLESALKLFDFESVKVCTKRSVAAKAKRAKELMSKPKKAKLSRTAKPGMILPFCGTVVSDWCCAVRLNHGLHTQCTNARIADGEYCKTCTKAAGNSATSKPPYGDIRERAEAGLNYRDPKGRQTLPYANVAAKLKLDLTKAHEAAKACGWEIPAEHLVKRAVKRGRPGKSAAVSDTESDASTSSKKLKKKLKIKKTAKKQSDLIAKLVAEAGEQLLSESDGESVSSTSTASSQKSSKKAEKVSSLKSEILALCEKHSLGSPLDAVSEMKTLKALRAQLSIVKKAAKAAEKEAAKAAKAAEKEAAKAAKAAEKEAAKAAKTAEKEAAKATKLAEAEAAKAAKLAEAEAAKAAKTAEKEAAKAAKTAEKEAAKAAKTAEKEAAKEEKQRQKLVKQLAKLGVSHTETTGTPLSALEGLLKLELARRETEKAAKVAAKAAKVSAQVTKLKAQLKKLSPSSPALSAELTPKALRAEIAKAKAEKAAAAVAAEAAPELEAEAVSCESEASDGEEDAEEEVEVVEKVIDGVTYLYDESGGFAGIPHLVLTPEQQPVGIYDPEQDHVVFQEFEVEE